MTTRTKQYKKPHRILYLAYGSNLNMVQMLDRCNNAKVRGYGVLNGYKLIFAGADGRSFLSPIPDANSSIPFGIYELTPSDNWYLDRYEGVPNYYYKYFINVKYYDIYKKRQIDASNVLIYKKRWLNIAPPSLAYVKTCLQGYADFMFDPTPLYNAIYDAGGVLESDSPYAFYIGREVYENELKMRNLWGF